MAGVKFDDFLLQYYLQTRFNDMPPEKRKTFMTYLENGDDFRGNMKMWKRRLMHDNQGQWEQNDLPDPVSANSPWQMSDDEWRKLYKEFREIMRSLDARASKYKDQNNPAYNKDAYEFVKEYFGPNKLFSHVTATPEAEAELDKLAQYLTTNPGIEKTLDDWGLVDGDFTFKALKEGLQKKEYNKNSAFRDKLLRLAKTIEIYSDEHGVNPLPAFVDMRNQTGLDFKKITDKGFDEDQIDQAKLDAFKGTFNPQTQTWSIGEYDILLRKIYDNKKIRKEISSSKVAQAFDVAQQQMGYDNSGSKDFLPDAPHDTLTPLQKFEKNCGKVYADVLKKYEWLRGDNLFLSPQAKNIVEALHKKNVKPTDGLDGILNAIGGIKGELQYKSASSIEHLDWMAQTLDDVKKVMPKAYESALYKGTQLKAVVSEIIVRALRENPPAVEQAKTMMEVLSVCKYGMTTSKIMDALRKEKVTLFSDGNLSWNKHEGVRMVMSGVDWVLEKALKGIGEGITIVGNAINKAGSKFNGKTDGALKSERNQKLQRDQTEFQQTQARYQQEDQNARQEITQRQQDKADVNQGLQPGQAGFFTDANFAQQKQTHQAEKDRVEQTKSQIEADKQTSHYIQATQTVEDYDELEQYVQDLTLQEQDKLQELSNIQQKLAALNTQGNQMTPEEKQAWANMFVNQAHQLQQELQQIQANLGQYNTQLTQLQNNPQFQAQLTQFRNDIQAMKNREQTLHNDETAVAQQESRITKWESANSRIDELNTSIDAHRDELANWDQKHKDLYKELVSYWDKLETGRDSRTGPLINRFGFLSTEKAQKDLDAKKSQMMVNHINNYRMA